MLTIYFVQGGVRRRFPKRPTTAAEAGRIVGELRLAHIDAWYEAA
jgi:hypothetical protein